MSSPSEPFLIRAVLLLTTSALLELDSVLRDRDLELALSKVPAIPGVTALLGGLELLETNRDDALRFLVVERNVSDFTEQLGLLAHIILDVKIGGSVFLELFERESMLDDDDLGPLVLLGSKDFLDFFLVVRPLS
jgi:hypothetical protein